MHETVALMAQRFSDVRAVELASTGHMVPLEAPDGLIAAVRDVFASVRSW
jgi:pimeloyl-ACP methyl ester carboxylesterase